MNTNYSNLDIKSQLLNLGFDIKAETFAAYLENDTDFIYTYSDFFKRRYSNDITTISTPNNHINKSVISLSRRSFYDIFPERFFHSTYSSTPYVRTMVSDYKNRKIEEANTRKFFQPIEQEFFHHRVSVEIEEDKILKSLGSPELVSFLTTLWNVGDEFPKKMAAKILKTMPFVHKIAGNIPLLTRILETIIQEKITVKKDFLNINTPNTHDSKELLLGVNFATSIEEKTYLPKYLFTIDKIKNFNNISNYLHNGGIISVVNFFLEHTLPFEVDFEIDITVEEEKQNFIISDTVFSGRLGISTTI